MGVKPPRNRAFMIVVSVLVALAAIPVLILVAVSGAPTHVILAVVLYVLLLVSYPWYTLTASVAAYLVFLPFSVLAYSKRARKEGEALLPPDVDEGTAGRD